MSEGKHDKELGWRELLENPLLSETMRNNPEGTLLSPCLFIAEPLES